MLFRIKAIQKTSLIDYPDKISCVVFLSGCNFKCGYCHNPNLINKDLESLDENEVLEFLVKKKKWLDGVVISGGEPLLSNDFFEFIKKVKALNYLVKIDTNGTNPSLLKELIENKLVDYIAMDLKNTFDKYEETVSVKVDIGKIKESIELIKNCDIKHEFRCTVLPFLHSKEDILEMNKLVDKLVLQQFNNKGKLLNPKFQDYKQFSKEELEDIKKSCNNCELRI